MPQDSHYLIPFASVGSDGCQQAWKTLRLPHLDKLLQHMTVTSTDTGDEYTLSPPHERAAAGQLGLWTQDGCTPWAAHELTGSKAYGYQPGHAWAVITPCFWHVGVDQIQMLHPESLQLSEADSRAVLEAVRPYFAEDGIALHYDSPMRWFAQSPLFEGLATASLDRVVGRNVNAWMSEGARAAPLRRLQNEMQMLLYTHPVNDLRQAAGQLAVNSFWVSGAGSLRTDFTPTAANHFTVLDNLRAPALHESWDCWSGAWQQLDATVFKDLNTSALRRQPFSITFCGERSAQRWSSVKPSLFLDLTRFLRRFPTHSFISSL
jgi:hypothetical protein